MFYISCLGFGFRFQVLSSCVGFHVSDCNLFTVCFDVGFCFQDVGFGFLISGVYFQFYIAIFQALNDKFLFHYSDFEIPSVRSQN